MGRVLSAPNAPDLAQLLQHVRLSLLYFWEGLTDVADAVKIRDRARMPLLTCQPFISWHWHSCSYAMSHLSITLPPSSLMRRLFDYRVLSVPLQ
jgi:hypothetical protein